MMNQTAVRMWDAGLSTLSPVYLVDRFLDWVEKLSAPIMPVEANGLSRQGMQIEHAAIEPLLGQSDA